MRLELAKSLGLEKILFAVQGGGGDSDLHLQGGDHLLHRGRPPRQLGSPASHLFRNPPGALLKNFLIVHNFCRVEKVHIQFILKTHANFVAVVICIQVKILNFG
jgi:hypothetical protein